MTSGEGEAKVDRASICLLEPLEGRRREDRMLVGMSGRIRESFCHACAVFIPEIQFLYGIRRTT